MSSLSPQRPRKQQNHQVNQAPMHTLQARETSRSPSIRERQRAMKTQTIPIAPSVLHMYGAANPHLQNTQGQQTSITISNGLQRSPPTNGQMTRLLPTPPQPHPPNHRDANVERASSPQLLSQHRDSVTQTTANTTHYPRPINRVQPAFLAKYQNMEDNWQMTEELLADIERADQQQSQSHVAPQGSYGVNYARADSPSSFKDPVERVRASERSSPKDVDNQQQRRPRDASTARDSPPASNRQPTSPNVATFGHGSPLTPERHSTPPPHVPHPSPSLNMSNFLQYAIRDPPMPPMVHRRNGSVKLTDQRQQASLASQTPPLQNITARTPDRSLPVQEEPEDDVALAAKIELSLDSWQGSDKTHAHEDQQLPLSPHNPSSDSHIDGNPTRYDPNHVHGGRDSGAGRHDENNIEGKENGEQRYAERNWTEEEGSYTPRSPTMGIPGQTRESYFQPSTSGRGAVRIKTRNGSTDHSGMRTLDATTFDNHAVFRGSLRSPMYPRTATKEHSTMQSNIQLHQQQNQRFVSDPRLNPNGRYFPPQVYPDDFHTYGDDPTAAYIQAFFSSPRPDAPIPPTPLSQTAAPSPSPLVSSGYGHSGKDVPSCNRVAPVDSPYPYPFSHMRRNQNQQLGLSQSQTSSYDLNHPATIQEQLAKQWQIFAQNNHGNMTDSTFSPSTTPFQGSAYNPWAFLHTNRTLGRPLPTSSIRSSPSHEPIPLRAAPGLLKERIPHVLRRQSSHRKPPPRVESTQPRETSPEPSSSGEETAGEEQFSVAGVNNNAWTSPNENVTLVDDDNSADWVDDETDDDDLLELEYHPTFINNIDKRRRRWESGLEALTQAFQVLDRQTDATMILLAAPSHTSKLHMMKSRSLRRQPMLGHSTAPTTEIKSSFKSIVAQRRNIRSPKQSLYERFMGPGGTTSGEGSEASAETREEDLKRALDAALQSLGALGAIYEQRESRWNEEMCRISEDRERVELLLRQVLGDRHPLTSQGT